MTGKIMPLRERDTSTVQAAADAFLSSPRYANPNTRRGYAGVLDRLAVLVRRQLERPGVLLLRSLGPGGPRERRSPCSALTRLGMLI
jgi:hypothetical protein